MAVAAVAAALVCDDGTIGALTRMNQGSPLLADVASYALDGSRVRRVRNVCRCEMSGQPSGASAAAHECRDMGHTLESEMGPR